VHTPQLELESIQAKSSVGIKLGAFKWMIGKTSKFVVCLHMYFDCLDSIQCCVAFDHFVITHQKVVVKNMGPWPYPIVTLVTMLITQKQGLIYVP